MTPQWLNVCTPGKTAKKHKYLKTWTCKGLRGAKYILKKEKNRNKLPM